MQIPSSTYRVQLHKDFSLGALRNILSYLDKLGVSTIYAAPILKSRTGSLHGYDVIDPHVIDPEVGTMEDLRKIGQTLREKKLTWLQDIVPNHMAFDTGNLRLMDVLERGPASPYYLYFDINWDHPEPALNGKVMVPFLGKPLEEALDSKEISIVFSEGGFNVKYFDTAYPLSIAAYPDISSDGPLGEELSRFVTAAKQLPDISRWTEFKADWLSGISGNSVLMEEIHGRLQQINDSVALRESLNKQFYLLCSWRDSETVMNYRRFFTVNELICLRMEAKTTFEEYHTFIHELYREQLIHGLRIDHIDGLSDPAGYVQNLRRLIGEECYIIAEKILEAKEQMPDHWPLEGSSGYEFLSYVSQLITDKTGARRLLKFYQQLVPETLPYPKLVFENKKLILEKYMAGEWENLTQLLVDLGLQGGMDRGRLKNALGILMISMPVYRIYPEAIPVSAVDQDVLDEAFRKSMEQGKELEPELRYLKSLFTSEPGPQTPAFNILKFLKRLMQFTGPITAKGVEDTTFYVYNPLISHDEVGDAPSTLGISIQSFHAKMLTRQRSSPLSLNATATHDTKRGEDARLRLNVLSEIPDAWESIVKEWMALNGDFRTVVSGVTAPSVNDEYFIYQSLIGGFPGDVGLSEEFFERFNEYLTKALREAKIHTNWSDPAEDYEEACKSFVRKILEDNHPFRQSFQSFIEMVSRYACLYALGQVLIKITAPGIPDVYQGCELWDLSFVDPDNRRPVDYSLRGRYLDEIMRQEKEGKLLFFHFLKQKRREGFEKLFVTWKALNFRRDNPELFTAGEYIPLAVSGKDAIVVAYARRLEQHWVLVLVPLGLARNREQDQPYASDPDDRRFVELPADAPVKWKNVLTGELLSTESKLYLFEAFKDFPVAFFTNC